MDWISRFFDTSGFPPRWHCGNWTETLGWLHIISDLFIFFAYIAIPITIVRYMYSRREVSFPKVFWIFGAFIFSCGTTHLIEVIIFWYPIYPVAGVVKAFTAIISIAAVILTARILPQALALPGLATVNSRLQAEITARSESERELARQANELKRTNQQLEQFAYIASHDLTEPLRKVRFFADIVVEETRGKLTETGEDALKRMSSATERMHRLMQDLLAFARAGKSLTNPCPVALDLVIARVIDTLDKQIREANASIDCAPLPEVHGEHSLLEQVFQNLVINALKYRNPQRPLNIRIRSSCRDGMSIITVSDNGFGFPIEQATRLFEPFVRLHRNVNQDGTGIGLAICKRIVEAHGGNIDAASNPDYGATFTVRLPLSPN